MAKKGLTKEELVSKLLWAKEKSGRTFDELAQHLGYTNVYMAQIFYNQQQLESSKCKELKQLVPEITDEMLEMMKKCPFRSFDPNQVQEPHIYRMIEAVQHSALGVKAIVNEQFGDGIMSAVDFFSTVHKEKGSHNEDRVVITFNGKFLPFRKQRTEENRGPSGQHADGDHTKVVRSRL